MTHDALLRKISSHGVHRSVPVQERRYGERYKRYRAHWAVTADQGMTPDFPLYVQFEQTFRCNLRCPNCLHAFPESKKNYNPGTALLAFNLYAKVIDECGRNGCPSVAMHSCDEPLLVPDIAKRIRYAREHGIMDVIMTTNGQLLTADIANACCDAGLTHIMFSIDAASEAVYKRVRVGGRFSRVLEAMEYVRNWKQAHNSELPVVRASFVLNRLNVQEQNAFAARFTPLVDYIDIQTFFSVDGLNRHMQPPGHRPVTPESFACSEPFRKLIVRANGDVVPCCTVFGYRQVMGNVRSESLRDIFNNAQMKALRHQLKMREFNDVCQQCVENVYVYDD